MAGPFDDLIPSSGKPKASINPFQDLIPEPEPGAADIASASVKRKAGQAGIAAGNILDDAGIKTGIGDVGRETVANNMPAVSSLEDVAKSPVDAAVQAVSETPVDMGINLAGRAIGAGIGGLIGRGNPRAVKAGEEIGGWLTSSAQSYGSIREEQKAEGIDSIPRALLAAGASGLVETAVGPERLISKYVKGGGKLAPGASRATNAVAEAGKAALGEGATEYVQSQIEQVGSGQDPFTVEGQKQAAFEGVMGAAGGGVIGGGVGAAAPREAVRPPQNTEEMMAQLATGQIPNAKIDSLIPAAPGAAQNETATAGPMERVVNQNQEILDAAGQAVEAQRAEAAAAGAVAAGNVEGEQGQAEAGVSQGVGSQLGQAVPPVPQQPSVGANLSAQPAQPAQPEALPFTPDPSRGPLSRAVATAVETGALAGPKSDVIAIPGQGQPAQQPLIIPGQQAQPAQQPIQVAEQPQSLRSRMSYDSGQRAAEEQAMQAEAEAQAKPKSRVAEEPQFEERRSNLGTPFKTELAAKAAARRPDNAGFTPTKLSANEWILRREVKKQDLPPSFSRFENPEYSGGQVSLDSSTSAATASPQSQDSGQKWAAFAPDSGTLGVPRAEMPQIKGKDRGALVGFLSGKGIKHESSTVNATELKPTQAEFSPEMVDKARDRAGSKRSILVSSDGHILDGHHQWLAARDAGEKVNVIKFDAPIKQLLSGAKEFPSAGASAGSDPRFSSRASISDRRGAELSVSGGPVDEVIAGTLGASAPAKPSAVAAAERGKPSADTAAAPAKSGRGWNDRPVQPDAVSLAGVHYTNTAGLKALDGRYYGTNHKGAESGRLSGLKGEKGKLLRNRIGFYPEGTDLAKTGESMVGRADVHRVQLDNLYDIDADPRGLKAKVDKPGMSDDDFYNALDMAIIKEGFDGIYVPKSRMIYLLGTKPVPVGARASQKPEIKERSAEASRPRSAIRADVIRRLADPITKSWSVKVNIVDTPDQFPDAVKAAPGFSSELSEAVIFGDEIYIAASQVGTVKDLYRLLAHEGVAHAGVEKMAGKQWPQLVKEINTLLDKGGWLAKEVSSRYPKADADTRAAEAIALMAERGVRSGVMSRLIAAARKFARDLGFNVQFTDRDLRDMIAAAARQMNSGKPRAEIRMSNQDQTETEAFKRWSGNSALVRASDAKNHNFKSGEPVTVEAFHGTPNGGFSVFDEYEVGRNTSTPSEGFYFTESTRNAATYSGARSDKFITPDPEEFADGDSQAGTYHAYVTFKDPMVVDFEGRNWDGMNADGEYDGFDGINDFVAMAIQGGHDGLIAKNVTDEGRFGQGYNWGEFTYVAFKSEQIKSVTNNNGQFDPANPDIRFSNQVEPGYEVEELDFMDFADVAGLSGGEQTSAALVAKAQESWREMGTASPFFREWFGKSKFKKADGTPVPLYHATSTDFDSFDPNRAGESTGYAASGLGIFMTPKRAAAERYGDKVLKLYARIEKPYIMSPEESGGFDSVAEARKRREQLMAAGYDGIFIKEYGTTIAFQPQQVKAADNRGTFDLDDVRMRFSNRVGPIVNIGLDVNDGSKLTKDDAIAALQSTGARVLHHRLKQSNTEKTLIAKLDRGLTPEEAFKVSADLRQDAIAQLAGRKTGLFGPEAAKWGSFNKDYFLRFSNKDQTETAAFKRWFKDSKVVDADGKPLVVYHGTNADFSVFDAANGGSASGAKSATMGFFAASNPAVASSYANDYDPYAETKIGRAMQAVTGGWYEKFNEAILGALGTSAIISGGNVMPLYLSIKNPKVVDFGGREYRERTYADVIDQAKRDGHDGVILRNTFDEGYVRGGSDMTDVYVTFDSTQIKSAIGNNGQFDPANQDIRFSNRKRETLDPEIVQILGKHIRNLTPAERGKLRKDTAKRIVETIESLPSANEMAAVAYAGRAKRGWYWSSARAIEHVFGGDAPRFAGLLAALSPQCSVETNLLNTLNTWKNWVAAGRPTDREAIIDIMGKSVQGGRGRASVLDAWINNTVRALSAEDPSTIVLSGPKVNSFMLNLRGVVDEVTNDAWMANYALVNQAIFGGSLTKGGDPGKSSGYMAMSAQVRAAAKQLTKLTGEEWTPAEVQETIWSWAKTLYESASVKRSAEELVADRAITDDLINSTPDFRTLFHDEVNEKILAEAGLGDRVASLRRREDLGGAGGEAAGAQGQAAPFAPEAQLRHETRAARRLDELRLREYPEDAGPRFSNKPVFYSALLRSIESGTMPKKAGPAAYKQWLDGALRRGELKQSERDWLGVDAWLDGQKEVTKQGLIEFVRANQVEVRETVLGEGGSDMQAVLDEYAEDIFDQPFDDLSADEQARVESEAAEDSRLKYSDPTKFSGYQLPFGQNYREMLLTLPGAEQRLASATTKEARNAILYGDVALDYKSSHFDQPNILAHVRFNERADADGKRVLFVEEVQSDWHQAGRKKGYAKTYFRTYNTKSGDQGPSFDTKAQADEYIAGLPESMRGSVSVREEKDTGNTVPDAPLKKEWPLTAMKRMIRYAADNGFDRIAWTTGDQQAERYDLSKQISAINYEPFDDGIHYELEALDLNGKQVVSEDEITIDRVEALVGNDIAKKIEAGEGKVNDDSGYRNWHRLSGLDLKVGGEGMRAFYDKMLPSELAKYVKKWGGKVGSTQLPKSSEKDHADDLELLRKLDSLPRKTSNLFTAPSIDITPAMREAALQGQPLFSNKPTLRERAEDLLYTTKTFNAWHNTVGTQYHKAQVDADFRAVYEKGQDFLNDVSRIAMESADYAPSLLPKLESLRDVLKRGPSAKDLEAVSDAVFTGTLEDETVYTDDELRDRFNLSDKQIGHYREFRAAIDASLDELNASEIVRITRDLIPQAAGQIRSNPADAARIAIDALGASDKPAALDQIQVVFERQVKIDELKMKGYAPLMRFGRYTVYVTDGAEQIYFGTFENEADATRVKREMQETYPQATVRQGVMSQEAWKQFKGISPDTLELFAEGAGLSYGEAFQEYLRLAKNNRSAMKRLIRRKGVAGFEQDASRVLASFITSNARAASTNYHFADMQRAAAAIDKEKGDVKDEAVKLAEYIQNPQEEAGALRGFLFTQFIGGSLASAVTNMTQPVMMTFPWLSQFAGTGAAAKHLASAGAVAAGQTPSDPDLRSALERATKDGVVAPHEIHQLYAESMRNFGSNPMIRKGLKVWGSFFSLAESFNRRISFVAAYSAAKEMGDEAVAMAGFRDTYDFAVNAVEATQGVYNRGNRPNWARGAIGATVFTFKQYSISYLEFLKRLPVKERALALGILVLASGLQGLPGAEDLEDLIDTIGQSLGYNTNSKKALREAVVNALGEDWGSFVAHGSSSFTPIDVQARMGLGNLIPGTSALKRSTTDRGRDALEAIGPAGGLIKQVMDSFSRVQAGDLTGAAASLAPLAVQNAAKGVAMAATGQYKDTQGRKVVDTTIGDAVAKGIGFQPASVADVQRVIGQEQQDINMVRNVEADIADAWAQALASGDPAGVRTAVARMRDWNSKNPTTPISIDRRQLIARVRAIKSTKAERTLKATPGQLKGGVAQALGQ